MLSHFIFLGIFYAVLAVIAATLSVSLSRAAHDFRARRTEAIAWQATFPDLPARDRMCRHQFTGEFKNRTCDHAFDCRECQTHAALIAKRPPEAAPVPQETELCGLEFPLDRFYHRGHAWAHPEPDGTVAVGLDPLGAAMLANPDAIDLPAAGSAIQVNGPAWLVRKRGVTVRILAPVDGEVVETGGSEKGWYLRIKPAGGQADLRHLLHGAEIRPWITREIERIHAAVAPAGQALTMADGGAMVPDVATAVPEGAFENLCGTIFLSL